MKTYSIMKLCTYIISVFICAYGLDAIDFTKWIKKYKVGQTRVLYVVLTLSLAYLFASFILNFITINLN